MGAGSSSGQSRGSFNNYVDKKGGGTLVVEDQWKVHGGRWGHMTKVRKY